MSRIRSVHPGLFTDEDFVTLSDAAQVFFIGLWTETDDYGAFEWKPITLKMKLRPASNHPVEPLLDELVKAGRVMKYEHAGRQYGLVRNFCRYQRPKSPKSLYVIPSQFRNFIGSEQLISEIDRDERPSIPPKAEIAPQMEDGGKDVGEGGKEPPAERTVPEPRSLRSPTAGYAFRGAVIRLKTADFEAWQRSYHTYPDLRAELETIDAKLVDEGHDGTTPWFGRVSGWLKAGHEKRLKAAANSRPPPTREDQDLVLRAILERWVKRGSKASDWPESRGIPPGMPGCQIPARLLAEFQLAGATP